MSKKKKTMNMTCYITAKSIMQMLKISRRTFFRYRKAGLIPEPSYIGPNKTYYWEKESFTSKLMI